MGLTTSYEAVQRQANPAPNEPDLSEAASSYAGKAIDDYLNDVKPRASSLSAKRSLDDYPLPTKKHKKREQNPSKPRPRKPSKASGPGRGQMGRKRPAKGAALKSASAKTARRTTKKAAVAKVPPPPAEEMVASPPRPPVMSAHRARIAIGKQALAVVKEGTRIFIKSGEGNGGDTWWDSGIIQKIHERGKRFEVEWHGVNNRGEEVDTNVERRIDLPVTYSLAGAAADAIAAASDDAASAALARKGVLAEARIGSWCIQYPQEPWGMLDPFGEDSSLSS